MPCVMPVDNDTIAMYALHSPNSATACDSLVLRGLGGLSRARITPVLQHLSHALTQLHENFATVYTRTQFFSHLFELMDVHLLNGIIQRAACCSLRGAEQMRLLVTQLEQWLRSHELPTRVLYARSIE